MPLPKASPKKIRAGEQQRCSRDSGVSVKPHRARCLYVNDQERLAACFQRVIDTPLQAGADVVFQVGTRQFGGFRNVLAMRCEVLGRMLLGDFREGQAANADEPIPVPGIGDAAAAFRQFLLYLHTGIATLDDVIEVMDLYEIASYFDAVDLKASCLDCLRHAETVDSMCVRFFSFAAKHEIPVMVEKVANHIAKHPDRALSNAKDAASLPLSFLKFLLRSNNVAVSEATLIRVVLESQPEQQEELLPFIRLSRVAASDMMTLVAGSGLFDLDACLSAMAFREDPTSVSLPPGQMTERHETNQTACFGTEYLRWVECEERVQAVLLRDYDCSRGYGGTDVNIEVDDSDEVDDSEEDQLRRGLPSGRSLGTSASEPCARGGGTPELDDDADDDGLRRRGLLLARLRAERRGDSCSEGGRRMPSESPSPRSCQSDAVRCTNTGPRGRARGTIERNGDADFLLTLDASPQGLAAPSGVWAGDAAATPPQLVLGPFLETGAAAVEGQAATGGAEDGEESNEDGEVAASSRQNDTEAPSPHSGARHIA